MQDQVRDHLFSDLICFILLELLQHLVILLYN